MFTLTPLVAGPLFLSSTLTENVELAKQLLDDVSVIFRIIRIIRIIKVSVLYRDLDYSGYYKNLILELFIVMLHCTCKVREIGVWAKKKRKKMKND